MDRVELIEAQKQASAALQTGAEMAREANKLHSKQRNGGMSGKDLGGFLSAPAHFWAYSQAKAFDGDHDTMRLIAAETQLASAKLASGDLEFAREALIGQQGWLSALAVQMSTRALQVFDAGGPGAIDRGGQLMRLALKAGQQAAQCVTSAAALNKLIAVETEITGG